MSAVARPWLRVVLAPVGAAAATLALVVAIGALAADLPRDAGAPILPVVPYVANPFVPEPTYVMLPAAPADLLPCLPAQLSLEEAEATGEPRPTDPQFGNSAYYFGFRNAGTSCALSEGPAIDLTSPLASAATPLTARRVDETASAGDGRIVSQLPTTWQLEADQRVNVTLILSGASCVHFQSETVNISIRDTLGIIATVELPEPNCPADGIAGDILDATLWTPLFPETPDSEPRNPLEGSDVTAEIDVSETVPVGREVTYTVTLSNPSDAPVPLTPCPQYHQVLGEGGTVEGRYGILNCDDAAAAIPARGTMTFEMRIDLPEQATAGFPQTLFWATHPDGSVSDGTTVTVTE